MLAKRQSPFTPTHVPAGSGSPPCPRRLRPAINLPAISAGGEPVPPDRKAFDDQARYHGGVVFGREPWYKDLSGRYLRNAPHGACRLMTDKLKRPVGGTLVKAIPFIRGHGAHARHLLADGSSGTSPMLIFSAHAGRETGEVQHRFLTSRAFWNGENGRYQDAHSMEGMTRSPPRGTLTYAQWHRA